MVTIMLHRLRQLRRLMPAALCAAAMSAHAQLGGDLQARILYAFQVEDANQLTALIQTLGNQLRAGGEDPALRYHLAHAQYRFGLLVAESRAKEAEAAFRDCTTQLKAVLLQDSSSAEAMALQSACYSHLARYEKLQAVLDRSRAAERLDQAARLAPRNPRVAYLQALAAIEKAPAGSADDRGALEQLQRAVQLFEETSATSEDVPGWGHAEAYLELGRRLQMRGDAVAARNWIERSLIAAPDYKAAQRQLSTLVPR